MTTMKLLPDWATNLNYATGLDAGTPTKIDPASNADGFVRGQVAAPQHVNFHLNALTPVARRVAEVAMLQLREVTSSTAISESQNFLGAAGGRTPGQASVVMKGGANDVSNIWGFSSREPVGSVASITSQVCGAARNGVTSGAFRILAIGTGGNRCCYSDDEGYTWTAGSNLGATPHAIVYNVTHARFMVTFAAGLNVARDGTGATTWLTASTGLASAQGGIAVLANGDTIAGGLDASGYDDFARSTDGGATWSVAGGALPNFGEIDHAPGGAGWIAGNNGATVYFVGRALGGTELRVCSSTDGLTWTLLKTFAPPGAAIGLLFTNEARILMCQQTGLLLVVTNVLGAVNPTGVAYASADGGATWTAPFLYASIGSTAHTAWGVADGRVFLTIGARLFASDGIGRS